MRQTDPNSLEHYGVLGMHWGIRKVAEGLATSNQATANAHRTAAEQHRTSKPNWLHTHPGITGKGKLKKVSIGSNSSLQYHLNEAKVHQNWANKFNRIAKSVKDKPYSPSKQQRNDRLFQDAIKTIAFGTTAAITVAMAKPAADMFGKHFSNYAEKKVFGKVATVATTVVKKTTAELAREALGG